MEKELKLINITSTDNIIFPGLLYKAKGNIIVIFLHGNGSSGGLYNVDRNNTLGDGLNNSGISYLTFSNRGSHPFVKFSIGNDERKMFGVAYELIEECIYDIEGAIKYAKNEGFSDIYLMGLSTGANKICVYDKLTKGKDIKGYILLSGGDDSGLFYENVGEEGFKKMMNKCKQMIANGKGNELISCDNLISYRSLYDQIDPDGLYNTFPFYYVLNDIKIMTKIPFIEFKNINKPSLIIYGSQDEHSYSRVDDCIELLKGSVKDKKGFTFNVIKGADHNYTNKNDKLTQVIIKWLKD